MKYVIMLLTLLSVLPLSFAALGGPSPIPAPPNFHISTTLTSLCLGQVNYIPITITNNATLGNPSMQSTELNLVTSKGSGLSAFGNSEVDAGTIDSNTTEIVNIPVLVGANASSYTSFGIGVNYYYFNLYSDSEVRNMTLPVYSCPSPLAIRVTPRVLASGSLQNLTLNLTNIGNATLTNIALHLSSSGGRNFSERNISFLTQPHFIASLAPGNSVRMNDSLYLGTSQIFPIYISGTFFNGNSLNLVAYNTSLLSGGMISLSTTSLTISPTTPIPGGEFSISFTLTNIGSTSAAAVTARPIVPAGFQSFGSNTTFIGDIGSDSQTPVTLSFTVSNTVKRGIYKIPVRISYLDSLRDNLSTWANFSVTVGASAFNISTAGMTAYRSRSSSGGILTVVLVVLIMIVIALAFLYFKERKRRAR